MIRIVLVSHYFPAHRGGVEIAAGQLATELASNADVSIRWFASDCDEAPTMSSAVDPEPVTCCNMLERRTGLPYPIWSPSGLARLARAIGNADLVHLHEYIYLGNLFAYAAARWHRKPVVITQHIGLVPYRNRALRALLHFVNRTVGRIALGRADRVVFISRSVQDYFSDFVRYRRAPAFVANGVDTSTFREGPDAEREQTRAALGADNERPLALFVGRFVEKKGLATLRELASRTPGIDWLFAGWGPMHPDNWRLPNVRVLEGRAGESLRPVYQAADLLVLPSYGEGFPLVVQEAMACGTPAIVSSETAAGSPEAAGLLYSEPLGDDAAARWSDRITAILSDRPGLAQRRQAIAAFARRHWSMTAAAAFYGALFDELMDRRVAAPEVTGPQP